MDLRILREKHRSVKTLRGALATAVLARAHGLTVRLETKGTESIGQGMRIESAQRPRQRRVTGGRPYGMPSSAFWQRPRLRPSKNAAFIPRRPHT